MALPAFKWTWSVGIYSLSQVERNSIVWFFISELRVSHSTHSSTSSSFHTRCCYVSPGGCESGQRLWRWGKRRSRLYLLSELLIQFFHDRKLGFATALDLSRVIYGPLIILYLVLWDNMLILGDWEVPNTCLRLFQITREGSPLLSPLRMKWHKQSRTYERWLNVSTLPISVIFKSSVRSLPLYCHPYIRSLYLGVPSSCTGLNGIRFLPQNLSLYIRMGRWTLSSNQAASEIWRHFEN